MTSSRSDPWPSRDFDFAQLVESVPHYMWSFSADGALEYLNPAGSEYLDLTEDEMLSISLEDLFPAHPEDADAVTAELRRAMSTGSDVAVECRARGADDEYRWMLLRGRPVTDDSGTIIRLVGTATDIDEQKRAATLLDTLMSEAPVGLGFIDREFRLQRVNPTLAAINGLPLDQQLGRPVAEVVPDLWPQLEPIYRRVLESREPVLDVEVEGETPASPGETRHWLVNYYPVTLEGDLIGIGLIAHETTERKRAEAELARAAEERQRLVVALMRAQESERRTIAANIHGDTMQVLAAVGLRLGELQETMRDPADRAALAEFAEACHGAQRRIRDLLFELWPPSLDRAGLPQALSELLGRLEEQTGIATRLSAAGADDLPPELRGLLFRVVSEAVGNVRKHSGGGRVEVELQQHEGWLTARVTDDGSGFDPERAFKPGHLGLLEMRERVEVAGGRISVTSAPGEGTTVEVSIPVGRGYSKNPR